MSSSVGSTRTTPVRSNSSSSAGRGGGSGRGRGGSAGSPARGRGGGGGGGGGARGGHQQQQQRRKSSAAMKGLVEATNTTGPKIIRVGSSRGTGSANNASAGKRRASSVAPPPPSNPNSGRRSSTVVGQQQRPASTTPASSTSSSNQQQQPQPATATPQPSQQPQPAVPSASPSPAATKPQQQQPTQPQQEGPPPPSAIKSPPTASHQPPPPAAVASALTSPLRRGGGGGGGGGVRFDMKPTVVEIDKELSAAEQTTMACPLTIVDERTGEVAMRGDTSTRLFYHGLGPCPQPPDGVTPYFLAAHQLCDLKSTHSEAEDVCSAIVSASKSAYKERNDNPTVFAWNDAAVKASPGSYPSRKIEGPTLWAESSKLYRNFLEDVQQRCHTLLKAFSSKGSKVGGVGPFSKVTPESGGAPTTGGTYASISDGLVFQFWNSASQARRFVAAQQRVNQTIFDLNLSDSLRAPMTVLFTYQFSFVSVTALVPLLRQPPVAVAPQSLLEQHLTALRAGLGAPLDAPLPVHRGGDGHYYLIGGIGHILSLSFSPPDASCGYHVRQEALQRYVLPAVAKQLAPANPSASSPRLSTTTTTDSPAASKASVFLKQGTDDDDDDTPAALRSKRTARSKSLTLRRQSTIANLAGGFAVSEAGPDVFPPTMDCLDVLQLLLTVAVPAAAKDLRVEVATLLKKSAGQKGRKESSSSPSSSRNQDATGIDFSPSADSSPKKKVGATTDEDESDQEAFQSPTKEEEEGAAEVEEEEEEEDDIGVYLSMAMRKSLLTRVVKAHGIPWRLIFPLLQAATANRTKEVAGSVESQVTTICRTMIHLEMIRRGLKAVARGVILNFKGDNLTPEQLANHVNHLFSMCASNTNGVWRKHLFAVIRSKYNTPKEFFVRFDPSIIQQVASQFSTKFGLMFDEPSRRFTGWQSMTYPFSSNTCTLPQFPFREVVEEILPRVQALDENAENPSFPPQPYVTLHLARWILRFESEFLPRLSGAKQTSPYAIAFLSRLSTYCLVLLPLAHMAIVGTSAVADGSSGGLSGDDASPKRRQSVVGGEETAASKLRNVLLRLPMLIQDRLIPPMENAAIAIQEAHDSVPGDDAAPLSSADASASCYALGLALDCAIALGAAAAIPCSFHAGGYSKQPHDSRMDAHRTLFRDYDFNPVSLSTLNEHLGLLKRQIDRDAQSIVALRATSLSDSFHKAARLRVVRTTWGDDDIPSEDELTSSTTLPATLAIEGVRSWQRVPFFDRSFFSTFLDAGLECLTRVAPHAADMAEALHEIVLTTSSACMDRISALQRRSAATGGGLSSNMTQLDLTRHKFLKLDRTTQSLRARMISAMRKVTTNLILTSHNPTASTQLTETCSLSLSWHAEHFGFTDAQTGISILHFLFVSLHAQLPGILALDEDHAELMELEAAEVGDHADDSPPPQKASKSSTTDDASDPNTEGHRDNNHEAPNATDASPAKDGTAEDGGDDHQDDSRPAGGARRKQGHYERKLALYRTLVGTVHSSTIAEVQQLMQTDKFLMSLKETIELMSLLKEWGPARVVLAEHHRWAEAEEKKKKAATVSPSRRASSAAGTKPLSSAAGHDEDDDDNPRLSRSMVLPSLEEEDDDFRLLSDDDDDEDIATTSSPAGRPARRRRGSEDGTGGDSSVVRHEIGEQMIDLIHAQVMKDFEAERKVTEDEESRLRRWRQHGPDPDLGLVPLLALFVVGVVEQEALFRQRLLEEESAASIQLPGCMEAHLWLVAVADAHDGKSIGNVVLSEETTASEKSQRLVLERQRRAEEWQLVKQQLLSPVKTAAKPILAEPSSGNGNNAPPGLSPYANEGEIAYASLSLRTDEARERRLLLEFERACWKETVVRHSQSSFLASEKQAVIAHLLDDIGCFDTLPAKERTSAGVMMLDQRVGTEDLPNAERKKQQEAAEAAARLRKQEDEEKAAATAASGGDGADDASASDIDSDLALSDAEEEEPNADAAPAARDETVAEPTTNAEEEEEEVEDRPPPASVARQRYGAIDDLDHACWIQMESLIAEEISVRNVLLVEESTFFVTKILENLVQERISATRYVEERTALMNRCEVFASGTAHVTPYKQPMEDLENDIAVMTVRLGISERNWQERRNEELRSVQAVGLVLNDAVERRFANLFSQEGPLRSTIMKAQASDFHLLQDGFWRKTAPGRTKWGADAEAMKNDAANIEKLRIREETERSSQSTMDLDIARKAERLEKAQARRRKMLDSIAEEERDERLDNSAQRMKMCEDLEQLHRAELLGRYKLSLEHVFRPAFQELQGKIWLKMALDKKTNAENGVPFPYTSASAAAAAASDTTTTASAPLKKVPSAKMLVASSKPPAAISPLLESFYMLEVAQRRRHLLIRSAMTVLDERVTNAVQKELIVVQKKEEETKRVEEFAEAEAEANTYDSLEEVEDVESQDRARLFRTYQVILSRFRSELDVLRNAEAASLRRSALIGAIRPTVSVAQLDGVKKMRMKLAQSQQQRNTSPERVRSPRTAEAIQDDEELQRRVIQVEWRFRSDSNYNIFQVGLNRLEEVRRTLELETSRRALELEARERESTWAKQLEEAHKRHHQLLQEAGEKRRREDYRRAEAERKVDGEDSTVRRRNRTITEVLQSIEGHRHQMKQEERDSNSRLQDSRSAGRRGSGKLSPLPSSPPPEQQVQGEGDSPARAGGSPAAAATTNPPQPVFMSPKGGAYADLQSGAAKISKPSRSTSSFSSASSPLIMSSSSAAFGSPTAGHSKQRRRSGAGVRLEPISSPTEEE